MKKTRERAHLGRCTSQDRLSYVVITNNSKISGTKNNENSFIAMTHVQRKLTTKFLFATAPEGPMLTKAPC